MSRPSTTATPTALEQVRISVWPDQLIDRLGHDPRSNYVERYWLGIMGPSTIWFLRLCVDALDSAPDGLTLDLAESAAALGIGHKGGRNSPLARSITRACRFGAARASTSGSLEVRRRLAPLNRGQVARLSPVLQARHQVFLDSQLRPDIDSQRRRARRLALGLVECGDGVDNAELQLGNWRFHPAIAADAVKWAWDCHYGPEAA